MERFAERLRPIWWLSKIGREINAEIRSTPLVAGGQQTFFRGRVFETQIASWEDMGPPPCARVAKGQRYNSAGKIALYLSTTERGVRCELEHRRLCIQEYIVDVDSHRIADFARDGVPKILNNAFEVAECAKVDGRGGLSSYRFPQFLAALAARAGFQGILVRGVRDEARTYNNLVMFDPSKTWKSWSKMDIGFRTDP
jgi:hypothetical protein